MKWLMVAMLLATMQGCALTVSNSRALQPIDGFEQLADDARVWVEPGYEAYGERVSAALPAAIAKVEAAHYLPFLRPPSVYVCGSEDCFNRYVYTPPPGCPPRSFRTIA